MSMDEHELSKEQLAKKIAGEIVVSKSPAETLQKWRNIFRVSQRELANHMGVMPSVISDYESGRRKSPGVGIINKIINAFISVDEKNGGTVLTEFNSLHSTETLNDAIIDIKEISKPISVKAFLDAIDGELVVCKDFIDRKIYGYTIIDSIKAIVELTPSELVRLYGLTTERAMIFTKVRSGRSSIIAMKVTNLKPGLVVFHKAEKLDALAIKIAETEKIPIAVSNSDTVDILIRKLKSII